MYVRLVFGRTAGTAATTAAGLGSAGLALGGIAPRGFALCAFGRFGTLTPTAARGTATAAVGLARGLVRGLFFSVGGLGLVFRGVGS